MEAVPQAIAAMLAILLLLVFVASYIMAIELLTKRLRFSLRMLLIATTLVAVALGAITAGRF